MKYSLTAIFALMLSVTTAHAAVLTVRGNAANTVVISLDTQGESVNAVEVHLTFDSGSFSVKSLSDQGSVVNLWIKPPAFSNASGTVDFEGIIPGGIVTGNGTLMTITLASRRPADSYQFSTINARALLNDGKGTAAKLAINNGSLVLASSSGEGALGQSPNDLQPPEAFTPVIGHDAKIFSGQYFIAFAASDAQSGIDHYEVLEVPAGWRGGTITQWQTATSPYLLQDQNLSSDIYVRAVDGAGNFRTVEVPAATARSSSGKGNDDNYGIMEFISAILLVILLGTVIIRWQHKPKGI